MTARRFSLRFSATFAFLMLGTGVQLPFLPLWLHSKGFGAPEIALVLSAMMVSRAFISPAIAFLADHYSNRVRVVQACGFLALLAYGLLLFATGFWQVWLAAVLAALTFAPIFPLAESYCIEGSRRHKLDYGRMRLWASLSFLVGNMGSGALLMRLDAGQAIWLIVAGQACAFLATLLLPPEPRLLAHKYIGDAPAAAGLRELLKSRAVLAILVVSLGMASHALLNGFSSVHWTSLGFRPFTISLLWMAAVLTEVALFAFSGRVVGLFGYRWLIIIGLAGGVLRWVGLGTFEALWLNGLMQALHAVTFAMLHLGIMNLIVSEVDGRLRNTAQGLYSAISGGVCMAIVTWLAGHLYGQFGQQAYYFMALISASALLFAIVLFGFIPKGRVVLAR